MSKSFPTSEIVYQCPWVWLDGYEQREQEELTADFRAALSREAALLREKSELMQRQDLLTLEFEHRLLNSLQIIVSLLSLQSRTASPEAAAQLTAAAHRISSFGRVHLGLHLLDHKEGVEFKQYLRNLCSDLSGLFFDGNTARRIVVEGIATDIPTTLAIPLGLIVNELITNSAKYAPGNITVRLDTTSKGDHSVSVLDDGPGLPSGFRPARSKGLGMRILASLVKQIGGKLQITAGENDRGVCFTVMFCSPRLGNN